MTTYRETYNKSKNYRNRAIIKKLGLKTTF